MNIADIAQGISNVPLKDGRRLVALVGAPASGKSTLAGVLAHVLSDAAVVPMDGFHMSNDILIETGLLERKGAPETFDVSGFVALVNALREGGDVDFPTFDRTRDCSVKNGGRVNADTSTIIVEGNYLLLTTPPWNALHQLWDVSIMLDVPLSVLRQRLIARWLYHGLDAEAALARALSNDIPNAQRVVEQSAAANLVIKDLAL